MANILIVGSGGRESALEWKLNEEGHTVWTAPGNGGSTNRMGIKESDFTAIGDFSEQKAIDLVVVGPEAPLAAGITDRLRSKGIRVFGPTKEAAQLEASKVFAYELMEKAGIPTPSSAVFSSITDAADYLRRSWKEGEKEYVIKADGLAQGKGVFVPDTLEEALDDLVTMHEKLPTASERFLISRRVYGPEVSVLAFVDGKDYVLLPASQDHKRIGRRASGLVPYGRGDVGKNTGGMGAYAPTPLFYHESEVANGIIGPVIERMNARKTPYGGILYLGLMITDEGPQVLEFNVRFGDPEIQAVLPLLDSSLYEAMERTVEGKLSGYHLRTKPKHAVNVVLASGGYPDKYTKGYPISGLEEAEFMPDVFVFHAGTERNDEGLEFYTAGGRVLSVTGLGVTLESAQKRAYEAVEKIRFQDWYYRVDIAETGIEHLDLLDSMPKPSGFPKVLP
ncbi:phosphoribosylamine--glycine ligase [Candidatus Woesearchaeota archaeon]|nr:phosphoribosylamine--glycine ligase [Candidatus Woesearchaeota archaeon]